MKEDLSHFDRILNRIDLGREGKTAYIPVGWGNKEDGFHGFPGMAKHFGVERSRYTVIAGDTGTGKSAFADQMYVLAPIDFLIANPDYPVKFEAIVWKMERKDEAIAKWMSQVIWNRHKILTDYRTLMSYSDRGRLPDKVYEVVTMTKDYFDQVFTYVQLHGSKNPTGIYHALNEYAMSRGTVEFEVEEGEGKKKKKYKSYTPNDPMLITTVMVDHIGIVDEERRDDKLLGDKALIDKTSEYLRKARDRYGFSPVVTQQLNRGMGDSRRRTQMVLKPEKSDFEGSSRPMQDSDLTMAFLDPSKFDKDEYFGYQIEPTMSEEGYCRFRGLHVIKNSYGADNLHFGLGFMGEIGKFSELPAPNLMTPEFYANLRGFEKAAIWSYLSEKPPVTITKPEAKPVVRPPVDPWRPPVLTFYDEGGSFDSLYDVEQKATGELAPWDN